jgi:three-Cys-motif partner protein
MPVDHEFGDQHTELKLSIVEKYLKFFATALRGKFEELWYIDAFAGTGSRTVRYEERAAGLLDAGEPERVERRRGSARIAIDVRPPFDFIVFIESKPSYVAALQELAANYPNRRIAVVKNDANDALKSLVAANNWRSTRAVLFLDPYGMQLEWSTLEKVAATKAIDVWFLFSLAGLYRQATRDLADIDQHKRAALTRMFGSDAWEQELYPKTMRDDLFEGISEEPRRRSADVTGLEAYAKSRLAQWMPVKSLAATDPISGSKETNRIDAGTRRSASSRPSTRPSSTLAPSQTFGKISNGACDSTSAIRSGRFVRI